MADLISEYPMKPRLLSIAIAAALGMIVHMGIACSGDDYTPRPSSTPPPGGAPPSSGSTNGNGDDPDAGDDTDTDAEGDTDVFACEHEPSDFPADPTRPCCFDDRDCWDSDAPQADEMYCYHADCEGGLQGVCRVPPAQEGECWDKYDCLEGQICPYEMDPDNLDCELHTHEVPHLCTDE